MKEIKLKIECQSCRGTGVYKGMGERDGAAVICYKCKGTGCYDYVFNYTEFTERVPAKNINRVYLDGYGYCLSDKKAVTLDNGSYVDFPNEGVSYEDFLKGKMPKHIKTMACPMMADQGACHDIKGFTEKCGKLNNGYVSFIPSCKYSTKKKTCWERFDKENKQKG